MRWQDLRDCKESRTQLREAVPLYVDDLRCCYGRGGIFAVFEAPTPLRTCMHKLRMFGMWEIAMTETLWVVTVAAQGQST